MKLPIASIKIGKRFRKSGGDIDALAASLDELGMLQPVVVSPDNQLVAGMRRIEAAKQLGWSEVPVTVVKTMSDAVLALKAERDENTCRLDFLLSEKVECGERIAALLKPEAEKRKGGRPKKTAAPIAKPKTGEKFSAVMPPAKPKEKDAARVSAQAAAAVDLSRPTFERAAAVVASGDPKLIEAMDRTGKVNGVYKNMVRQQKAEAIVAEPPPLPKGKHRVIVIDPPWHYESREKDETHRASNPYPSMTVEDITAMPVADFAEDDAVLWLWVTNAHLPHAFGIAEAWGFTYKTMLTWDKVQMGTGDWLRGQTEHCLMCVRGRPTILLTNQTTIIRESRGRHSAKPTAFYEMIEKLCPGSKLEMFQRTPREGWNGWGDEA